MMIILFTSGEQTVLTIKDNKVQLDIPETTDRKAGNPIRSLCYPRKNNQQLCCNSISKSANQSVEEENSNK